MKKKYLVVGGGLNGLAISEKLCRAGNTVVVVERNKQLGGLARTFDYGNFKIDNGPHWIYTEREDFYDYIKEILGEKLITSQWKSGVYFLNKYYAWPLSISVIFKLPIKVMWGALIDLFSVAFSKRQIAKNHAENTLNKYGKTLYELDFRPYSQKVTNTELEELHTDWGKIGMERSIDEKPEIDTIWGILKKTLSIKKPIHALYIEDGIQVFIDTLQNKVLEQGGQIHTNTKVEKFTQKNGKIISAKLTGLEDEIEFDHVIWTGNINEVSDKILKKAFDLEYISTTFYNVLVKGTKHPDFPVIYYVSDEYLCNRVYNTKYFSKSHTPENCYAYCVEVTCKKGEEIETNPEKFIDRVIDDLIKVKALKSVEDVIDVKCEATTDVYPLYKVNYREELQSCINELYANSSNITLSGRTGLFWYNNMDHTVLMAIELAQQLIDGKRITPKISN